MNKIRIDTPKVFISYAWGTKEYQDKVLSFATELVRDGIDVLLDKWSMKEGNDTYHFMEQSVNDPTVTNVLLLLDPVYKRKANERRGGVGTETQIISTEIYNNTTQEKVIPVVFEREDDGSIPKPTYLKTLLHFDLSIEEHYDEEYQRLVRTLYGIETYKKPELGKKPAWLESELTVSTKTRSSYSVFRKNVSDKIKKEKFEIFLSEIRDRILDFRKNEPCESFSLEKYLESYSQTVSIREDFLQLITNVSYIEGGEKLIASKLEEIGESLQLGSGYINSIQKTFLHELFIYVIAIYYKNKNYSALSYTLNKTYFVDDSYECTPNSFKAFYHYDQNLDNAVCKRDNKNYYSGTANYWIENISREVCSKNEFIFADILCYNVSVFQEECNNKWNWFPLTYIYGDYDNRQTRIFSNKLKSMEHLTEITYVFGYNNIEEFRKKFCVIESAYQSGALRPARHSRAFNDAPLLCMFIKSTELGSTR